MISYVTYVAVLLILLNSMHVPNSLKMSSEKGNSKMGVSDIGGWCSWGPWAVASGRRMDIRGRFTANAIPAATFNTSISRGFFSSLDENLLSVLETLKFRPIWCRVVPRGDGAARINLQWMSAPYFFPCDFRIFLVPRFLHCLLWTFWTFTLIWWL